MRLSNPDKVYFPERGFTKVDVVRYYLSVGDGILRALRDRPTTLERYPDGVEGESFFQKRAPKNLPDWIPTGRISFPSGRHADEICPTETGRRRLGGEPRLPDLPPLAGAPRATPTTPTNCASTSTRSRARTTRTRCGPPRNCATCSTTSA